MYEQGLRRLRTFDQYSKKLLERFPDLQIVLDEKTKKISGVWKTLERCLIGYFDEDVERILQGETTQILEKEKSFLLELHKELLLFERWLNDIDEQLEHIQDCQQVLVNGLSHIVRSVFLLFSIDYSTGNQIED